ncbi:MAG: iron-containing alcohol dehydrogenase [Candidatus Aminicenantes bacterium]|nr:iron-containing alcohol dehydrogenase [Candidatus Aminicenantes bacterium]
MQFHNPTRIIFGSGAIKQVKAEVERAGGDDHPLIVTDRGLVAAGLVAKLLSEFPRAMVFDEVENNPRHTTVNRAGDMARRIAPRVIIGLGGGSALDAAKAVALLATNPGGIEDYEGRAQYKSIPLPLVAVPTTCGTGSEVTWVSVITHSGRKFKMSIKGPAMFPATALVDPDLVRSLPEPLVASTGMDALTHAVEAFTARPANALTDMFAREAFRLILSSITGARADIKANTEARERLMLGSLTAGLAFGNSDVGAVHCLAESIGALFDTPHGTANAVFLPYVMEFNAPAAASRYAELARLAGIEDPDESRAAQKLIGRIRDISRQLGIPSFRSLNLPEGAFQELAEKSFANNSNPSNARDASAADYLAIIRKAAKSQ